MWERDSGWCCVSPFLTRFTIHTEFISLYEFGLKSLLDYYDCLGRMAGGPGLTSTSWHERSMSGPFVSFHIYGVSFPWGTCSVTSQCTSLRSGCDPKTYQNCCHWHAWFNQLLSSGTGQSSWISLVWCFLPKWHPPQRARGYQVTPHHDADDGGSDQIHHLPLANELSCASRLAGGWECARYFLACF